MFFYQLKILTKYYSNATLLEVSLKCKSNFSKISKELRLFLLHLLHSSHLPHAPSSLIFSAAHPSKCKRKQAKQSMILTVN